MRVDDVVIGDLYHVNHYDWRTPCRATAIVNQGHTIAGSAHGRSRVVHLQRCDRDGNPTHPTDRANLVEAPARDLTPWADWWAANASHARAMDGADDAGAGLVGALRSVGLDGFSVERSGSRVRLTVSSDDAERLAALVAGATVAAST